MSSRKLIMLGRVFRTGFVNLFRNAWLTIAATVVMVVALSIILLAVVLNMTANNAIDELALDLKAEIYLNDNVSEDAVAQFRSGLAQLDFVVGTDYISPEDAKRSLTETFKDDQPELIEVFVLADNGEGDALPASIRVTVDDLERMPEVKDYAETSEYAGIVEEVSLGKDDSSAQETIDKAAAGQKYVNTGSIIAAGVLSLVAIMIIFNTIRMAIYTRRDEIRIMKLIGATPDYIRAPFLIEASLYGVLAGLISSGVVYSLVFFYGGRLSNAAEFAQTYAFFTQPRIIIVMTACAIMTGVLIGSFSSMLAMEKHLKLKHW